MSGQRSELRLAGVVALVTAVVAASTVAVPSLEQLRTRFGDHGPWAVLLFAGLYAAVSLTPLPKTVFSIAAGAVFGFRVGLTVVLLGADIGAIAAFYLARTLGFDAVRRLAGTRVERFDSHVARRGLWAVLAARLVPVVPFTAVNYLAGLTTLRVRDFVLGTVVGILPATAAAVAIGAYGSRPGSWPFLVSVALLLLLAGIGVAAGIRRRRRSGG